MCIFILKDDVTTEFMIFMIS